MTQPFGTPPSPPPVSGSAPASVENAFRVMLVRAALGIVGILVALVQRDEIKRIVLKNNPTYSPDKVDQVVTAAIGISIFFGLVFLVLFVALALQVRKGKNWARIVTYVLAGLGILGALISFANATATGLSKGMSALVLIIDIAVVVLLTRPESHIWFSRRQQQTY